MRWSYSNSGHRNTDHSHSSYNSNSRYLGLGIKSELGRPGDISWINNINNMPVEGLLSIYRGKYPGAGLPPLSQFRNNELVDMAGVDTGAGTPGSGSGGRRMSITNAMDILRDRLLRAIKRKQTNVSMLNAARQCL